MIACLRISGINFIFLIRTSFRRSRSSHRRCSVRKGVLGNFAKFTGKHLYLQSATLLKNSLCHRCFPVNFAKFLRTLFLQSTYGRLLLVTAARNRSSDSILFLSEPFLLQRHHYVSLTYGVTSCMFKRRSIKYFSAKIIF